MRPLNRLGVLLSMALSHSLGAQVWDSSFDASLRSYPLGAAVGLEGGYNVPIWGDTTGLSYGFTRVGARVQSSGVVNRVDAKFSVFPISFWGLELRTGWGHRSLDDIATLDCATLQCSGSLTRTSLGSPLYFGAGPYFGRAKLEYTWIAASDSTAGALADEQTNLVVRASGDELRRWEFLGGLKLSDDFSTFAFWERVDAQKTASSWNRTYGLALRKTWEIHTLYLGAGVYEAVGVGAHGQLYASYVLTFTKGLGF